MSGDRFNERMPLGAETPEAAAREADIIVCVTLADRPFIEYEWLKKGCLLMNMADYEVSNDCVAKASKIVVDNWDSIKHRMISTVALMWKDGLIKDEDISAQLGEILIGSKPGRENDAETICASRTKRSRRQETSPTSSGMPPDSSA